MAVSVDQLASRHPTLYHMAHRDSWRSIRQHGLLSTRALLSLFEVPSQDANRILSSHRAESVEIRHSIRGSAVIRDQKPMSDEGLWRALQDDLTPADWYQILNDKVFFWPSEDRLQRMMNAPPYRRQEHVVLVARTDALLRAVRDRVLLSPLNSGATRPMPHPRGLETFQPMDSYPYFERKQKGLDPVAEIAIADRVADVERFLLRVEVGNVGSERTIIWTP